MQAFHFLRVFFQIEELPLVGFGQVKQLVAVAADAVVGGDVLVVGGSVTGMTQAEIAGEDLTWFFDVYVNTRFAGYAEIESRYNVMANITQTDEWRCAKSSGRRV